MDKSPVCVYQAADVGEAQLVKDLLQEAGIEARVVGENQPYAGLLAATSVDVLVAEVDQVRAENVVAQYDEQKLAQANLPAWKCLRCGASVPGTFDACFECGADRAGKQPPDEEQHSEEGSLESTSSSSTGATPGDATSSHPQREILSSAERRNIWFEIGVVASVLATIYYGAISVLIWPEEAALSEWTFFSAQWQIIRDLQYICIVLYLMWRSGEGWQKFGLVRPQFSLDLPLGLGVFLVDFFIILLLQSLRTPVESDLTAETAVEPYGTLLTAMIILSLCIGSFSEELMMRGFLQTRFEQLFGSRLKSILLASLLFAGYHMYQGAWAVLIAGVAGIVYGAAFCWFRRIWPVAIAHMLYNLYAQFLW